MKTHGVITDTELLFKKGKSIERVWLGTHGLDDLLEISSKCGVDTAWIQPGSKTSYWPADDISNAAGWDLRPSVKRKKDQRFLKGISARRGKTWLTLTWPEHSAYEWHGQPTGETMLTAGEYVAGALWVPLDHNPGVMGRSLMKACNASDRRKEWIEAPTDFDFDVLPAIAGEGYAYVSGAGDDPEAWLAVYKHQQGITGDAFVQAWDCNSQHPAASKIVQVGRGKPRYHKAPGIHLSAKEKRAAYWRISNLVAPADSLLHELNPLEVDQEWVTTPLLQLLQNEGAEFDVEEAWIWDEQHAIFDTFAQLFWDGRQALAKPSNRFPDEAARALAYYSVKRVGAACVGLLKAAESKLYHPEWYRPDWWRFIVEQSRVLAFYKAKKVWQLYKKLPLMIASDCFYYLCGEQAPEQALAGCFDRADQLGGYKTSDGFPVLATPEIISCFKSDYTPGMAIVALREERKHAA